MFTKRAHKEIVSFFQHFFWTLLFAQWSEIPPKFNPLNVQNCKVEVFSLPMYFHSKASQQNLRKKFLGFTKSLGSHLTTPNMNAKVFFEIKNIRRYSPVFIQKRRLLKVTKILKLSLKKPIFFVKLKAAVLLMYRKWSLSLRFFKGLPKILSNFLLFFRISRKPVF